MSPLSSYERGYHSLGLWRRSLPRALSAPSEIVSLTLLASHQEIPSDMATVWRFQISREGRNMYHDGVWFRRSLENPWNIKNTVRVSGSSQTSRRERIYTHAKIIDRSWDSLHTLRIHRVSIHRWYLQDSVLSRSHERVQWWVRAWSWSGWVIASARIVWVLRWRLLWRARDQKGRSYRVDVGWVVRDLRRLLEDWVAMLVSRSSRSYRREMSVWSSWISEVMLSSIYCLHASLRWARVM